MTTANPPTGPLSDIAKAIRKQLRDGSAERKLGLTEWDVASLANRVQSVLPKVRPVEPRSGVPRGVRERALAVAGNREAAEKRATTRPAPPVATPKPVLASVLSPGLLIAVERLLADPDSRRVGELIAEERTNRQIVEAMGLPLWRVKRLTSKWFQVSEQRDRLDVGAWIRRTGVLEPKGAES